MVIEPKQCKGCEFSLPLVMALPEGNRDVGWMCCNEEFCDKEPTDAELHKLRYKKKGLEQWL